MNVTSVGHVPPGFARHAEPQAGTTTTAEDGTPVDGGDAPSRAVVTTNGHTTTFEQTENGFTRTRTKELPHDRTLSKTVTVEHTESGTVRTTTITNPQGKVHTFTSGLLDSGTIGGLIDDEGTDAAIADDEGTVAAIPDGGETAVEAPAPVPVIDAAVAAVDDDTLIEELLEEVLAEGEPEEETEGDDTNLLV